jgi:hypothetical protein
MKTFKDYLIDNHPEIMDEGILDSLGKNKLLRSALVAGSIAGMGLGISNKASAAPPVKKPVASKLTDEEQDIEDEKAEMLDMAKKVPMKTSTQKVNGKDVVVSRGKAQIIGGKVVANPSQINKSVQKATKAPVKKFDPTKRQLPQLPSGVKSSPDFGRAVESFNSWLINNHPEIMEERISSRVAAT